MIRNQIQGNTLSSTYLYYQGKYVYNNFTIESTRYNSLMSCEVMWVKNPANDTLLFLSAEPVWHYAPGHYGNRYSDRYVMITPSSIKLDTLKSPSFSSYFKKIWTKVCIFFNSHLHVLCIIVTPFFSVKYSHYIMHVACPNLSGAPDDQNYDFKYVKLFQMLFSSI